MVAFYNPPANTIQDSLWGVYFGTWHNGSTTADTWDGSATGVFKSNGDTSTWTETNVVQNNANVGITASLCNGLPGEFWAVDFDDLGAADSILILYKGIWNPLTRDVEWSITQHLNLPLTLDGAATFNITPVIGFDPSGMNGWVATSADVIPNANQVYEPIFYRTTNGGANWTGPIHLDLTSFPSVMATMDPGGSGIPSTAFDADIVVDMYGNPHYATVIGSGVGHSLESGFTSYYPSVSVASLRNNSNNASLVPVVVARPNVSGSGEDPATFYYFNNIQFDDALFVGVPESPAKDNSIRVFPNPASDEITVYVNGVDNANATVTITDVLGKTVKVTGHNFSGRARFNIRGLDAGIYFISIKTESRVVTQRFVVSK